MIALLLVAAVQAEPIAVVGEPIAGWTVEKVVHHAHVDRVYLRDPDGERRIVEVRAESCDPPADPILEELCSRRPVAAGFQPAAGSPWKAGEQPLPWGGVVLRVVLAAMVGLGAFLGRKARVEPLLLFFGALVLRALREPVPFVGPDAAFEVMSLALGEQADHALYGGGFGALHALGQAFGPSIGAIWATQLLLGALAAPLMWALLRGLCPEDPWAARFAGLAMLALPLHVVLSASEVVHVGLVAVELTAAAALAGTEARPTGAAARPWGPAQLLAGLAAGFAAHLRPEAVPVSAVLIGLLAWRRGWAGAALGAGLLIWRIAELPVADGAEPARLADLASPWMLWDVLAPTITLDPHRSPGGAWNVGLHAALTPLVLAGLAGFALWRDPRRGGVVLAVLLAALLPVLNKSWPNADAWRLQLPALTALVALAGLGAAQLPERARWGALGLQLAWSAVLLPRIAPDWTTHAAWRWLQDQPPVASILVFPDHGTHGRALGQVLQAGHPDAVVTPLSLWQGGEAVAWWGPTCALAELPGKREAAGDPCGELRARCDLTPIAEVSLPARGDLDLVVRSDPVVVGLYRIGACR
jgi:hypothetical protein